MQGVNLDFWSVLFFIAAAQGAFLSLVLFSSKKNGLHTRLTLGTLILSFSITLLFYVFYWVGIARNFRELFNTTLQVVFLFGPLVYLYVKRVSGITLKRAELFHFAPFVVIFAIYLVTMTQGGPLSEKYFYSPAIRKILIVLQNLSLVSYSILVLDWMRKIELKKNNVKVFLSRLSILFLIFTLSFLSYYILSYSNLLKPEFDYAISLCMSIIIFYIGYQGYFIPEIQNGFNLTGDKYIRSGLSSNAERIYAEKLLKLIDDKKIYLNSELKISDLAHEMEISVHHLSQIINSHFNQSFSDFINSFRIKQAIEIMRNNERKSDTIIGIAYSSGFNNKVSFNNSFRKFTGVSPSLFRKLVKDGKMENGSIKYHQIEV